MSYLDRLRADDQRKAFAGTPAPTKPTEPGFVSSAGSDSPIKTLSSCAAEGSGLPSLSTVQEAGRRVVLARLEGHPDITRAFVSRFEGDVLVITLAIRGVGTCELSIPPGRFKRDSLSDFDALARCLEGTAV
jgi:hypothetical protein